MVIDLSGKVAFVTGGSSGIGAAITNMLITCGARVGVMAIDGREVKAFVNSQNEAAPGTAYGITGDVADAAQVTAAVDATEHHFGGLHLAVNNAGIAGKPGLLDESGVENWRRVLGVNLDGVAYSIMAEAAAMKRAGGGAIVNIASVEAHTVLKHFPAYVASKHAVIGLTKATAFDYAEHGIRINSVSPGVIETPLTTAPGQKEVTDRLAERIPLNRIGKPEEIARTVAFLLSDLSGYTTGADFVVDGAYLLRD